MSTTKRSIRWKSILSLLSASVVLTSCGASSDEAKSPTVSLPEPLPVISATSAMPYDAYTLTNEQRKQLDSAFNQLVMACATRYDVDLTLVTQSRAAIGRGYGMWAGRFGTLPLGQARTYGYHAKPGGPVTTPFTVFVHEDEEPQHRVLNGDAAGASSPTANPSDRPIPSGGCRGEAMRRIGGDPRRIGPANAEALRLQAFRDSRTEAAMGLWRKCMQANGYKFETVDGAVDSAIGKQLSPAEKALAVADVKCTRSSRWSDVAYALQTELQLRSIASDRAALASKFASDKRMYTTALQFAGPNDGKPR